MPIIQFKGKTAVESYHRVVPHHTLEIDGKLSLGKKPSLEGNLIIEGDNLVALKSLLPTHAGKFKCIYIDPPYNTGNEGWIYNDNLTQPQFKEWIGQGHAEFLPESSDGRRQDAAGHASSRFDLQHDSGKAKWRGTRPLGGAE